MAFLETALERFFHDFEQFNNSGNIAAQVAQFADVFLAAGPQGAFAVRASDFALALPRRKQLFESLGCRSSLVDLRLSALDGRYAMAQTRWRMAFENTGEILADSTFIIDTAEDAYKIVFYLASQDVVAVLRERGVLAAQA